MLCRSQIQNTMAIYVKMYASSSEFVSKDELIQSEIQSDIISEKSLSLPAEVFRFRSVPFREIYPTMKTYLLVDIAILSKSIIIIIIIM